MQNNMNLQNLKRPSLNETDESLLEEQRKYFEKVRRPSVRYASKYSEVATQKAKTEEINRESGEMQECKRLEQEGTKDNLDILSDDILLDVKERDVSLVEPFVFQPPMTTFGEIHQKIKNRNIKLTNVKKDKNKSIFAQLLTSAENQSGSEEERESKNYSTLIDGSGLKPETRQTEILKIHEENLARLSNMSVEDILHEQQQIKMSLKPELLNFIRKRKQTKESKSTKARIQNGSDATKTAQSTMDLPGETLRKEGKEDCDALILGKVMECESDKLTFKETDINSMSRKNESCNFEIPQETKELIDGSNKGFWRNMNKVEKEKLEWMTNLPQPKPLDSKAGYTARFDFEGKLLSRDADIPMYEGLHHHGDEPEVPGYSLEELFLLARSSVQAQRITALNIVAHILENNWCGMMDTCFDAPLLPLLLNAGLVPLLRWALDDTSITSVSATISAIHSLLISKADELHMTYNKTFCWLNGHFVAQLEPQGLEEPNVVIEELTDADLIKLDVIKAFLRIDILPRFMYILKVMCPPPLVCKLKVEICAHLAQHSPESAKKVAAYPDFLNLIFEKFLPMTWHFVDSSTLTDTVGYSCPMPSALKLMRIIISSSKELASEMIEKHDILSIITYYLSLQPCDGKLPPHEVQLLALESLKMWHSFLCFGFGSSVFWDLFPNFLKQLDFCLSLNLNCDIRKHVPDFDYATHLFKTFEAVTVVVADNKEYGLKSALPMNTVFKETLPCLKKWLSQFSQESTSSHGMILLAACMNFVVTHCQKSHEGLICENWEPCSAAKVIFEEYLLTALKSNIFQNLLCEFRHFSLYLCPELTGNKRDGKTIVSLGSMLHGEDVIPILKIGSPLPLLSAVLNYILFYKNSFQDTKNECFEFIFCNSVMDYLKAVSTKRLKSNCWFLKFETYYIYQLVKLASLKASSDLTLCHETAISILPAFTLPEECLVEDLFENIIFNQSTILNMASLLQSSGTDEINTISVLASRLPVIAQCYISCFLNKNALNRSRNVLLRNTNIDSLFFLSTPSSLVPRDWCFMPIFYLYQKAKTRIEERCLPPEGTLQVICCLQWIVMGHLLNLPVLKVIPAAAKFYYLCSVFLLDENLFREEKVKDLLIQCCLLILKAPLRLAKINWNGIKNFDEMYLQLLIQYEAVSYGDTTFGNFLVIPLQQCYPKQWKALLLTEHLPVLGFLRVSLSNLLVPLENFLEPVETDISLLLNYLKALASGSLDYRRCPLVYLMAVHHIHNFIFTMDDSHLKDQKLLLLKILAMQKDLKNKILGYLEIDVKSEYGFTIAAEISSERKNYICNILGDSYI